MVKILLQEELQNEKAKTRQKKKTQQENQKQLSKRYSNSQTISSKLVCISIGFAKHMRQGKYTEFLPRNLLDAKTHKQHPNPTESPKKNHPQQ